MRRFNEGQCPGVLNRREGQRPGALNRRVGQPLGTEVLCKHASGRGGFDEDKVRCPIARRAGELHGLNVGPAPACAIDADRQAMRPTEKGNAAGCTDIETFAATTPEGSTCAGDGNGPLASSVRVSSCSIWKCDLAVRRRARSFDLRARRVPFLRIARPINPTVSLRRAADSILHANNMRNTQFLV